MKRMITFAFVCLAACMAWPQAAEKLTTSSSASVTVGHNAFLTDGTPVNEHVRLVANQVMTEARHCQNYLKSDTENSAQAHALAVAEKHDDEAQVKQLEAKYLSQIVKGQQAECAADPATLYYREVSYNLRTNAGADAQASQMGNTATQAASCNWIALTNDATAPGATDTTLTSEIATNGLSRAQGTYAHTNGTAVFTVAKTFNATGTQASQKSGLFNASTSGTLCFENTYSAVTVNNGDTLTVTWTINI